MGSFAVQTSVHAGHHQGTPGEADEATPASCYKSGRQPVREAVWLSDRLVHHRRYPGGSDRSQEHREGKPLLSARVPLGGAGRKNAFNSVRFVDALQTLKWNFKVPQYPFYIIGDYLRDHFIVYETEDGPKRKELTAGAVQASILGPVLWNASYDGILRLEMLEGCFLTGYADDVAAVISTRDVNAAQMRLGQVMSRVRRWMFERGLELALTKTEMLLFTKKRIPPSVSCTGQRSNCRKKSG